MSYQRLEGLLMEEPLSVAPIMVKRKYSWLTNKHNKRVGWLLMLQTALLFLFYWCIVFLQYILFHIYIFSPFCLSHSKLITNHRVATTFFPIKAWFICKKILSLHQLLYLSYYCISIDNFQLCYHNINNLFRTWCHQLIRNRTFQVHSVHLLHESISLTIFELWLALWLW